MSTSFSNSYKDAGVDVEAGYRAVELMRSHVAKTFTPGCISGIGGFGGMFRLPVAGMQSPVLVSGTDGVGTKLKIAFLMDKHDTIGIDCVAMCVNDVVCSGAAPLFFLDYIAVGKNKPERVAEIVKGIADGCLQAGCALVGGETAEMPGFYPIDEYDVAGFSVGLIDESKIITGQQIKAGYALIGLASSGVHSNGYSLVRRVFRVTDKNIRLHINDLGRTIGEELLVPTKIYVKSILTLAEKFDIGGMAHITGGGFYENIPRMLPEGLSARIQKSAVRVHPVFKIIQSMSSIDDRDMFNTFNMGVGMVIAVPPEQADAAVEALNASGETAYIIGEVVSGGEGIDII